MSDENIGDRSAVCVGNQHLLYELLNNLYQQKQDHELQSENGILRSIDYMQEHYDQVITRGQLAQIAGITHGTILENSVHNTVSRRWTISLIIASIVLKRSCC